MSDLPLANWGYLPIYADQAEPIISVRSFCVFGFPLWAERNLSSELSWDKPVLKVLLKVNSAQVCSPNQNPGAGS